MKKQDLVKLEEVFNEVKGMGETKFKYNILRNMEIIQPFLKPLKILEQELKTMAEPFEQDRNALIIELGHTNPDGTASIDRNDTEVMEIFKERLNSLITVHKEELDKYQTQFEEYQEILQEDIEDPISFRVLSIDKCPDTDITETQLQLLMEFGIIVD